MTLRSIGGLTMRYLHEYNCTINSRANGFIVCPPSDGEKKTLPNGAGRVCPLNAAFLLVDPLKGIKLTAGARPYRVASSS